jgi:PAS domain S-box-containing protein
VHADRPTGLPEATAGLAAGQVDAARALARRTLADAAPASADGLVCECVLPLPGAPSTGCDGWIAVFASAAPAAPPGVADSADGTTRRARLAMLARALAAQLGQRPHDRRLERLARHVPGVLYQFQRWPDGRMAMPFATEDLQAVFGVAPAAVAADASALFARALPEDLPRILASIEHSMATLTPWDCEYRIELDGRVRWHHGYSTPERLDDGSTLWHGFIMPIDERKRAQEALRRSEEGFRHFFEAGLVGMTIAAPERGWLSVNRRMAEMLGYTPEEIARLDWADFTHPDDLAADEAQYTRMAAGEVDGYVMDKRYLKKDGSVLECALAVRCERDEAGALRRVFAIVEDIDERRRAERALQAERDGLERQVAERTRELVAARDEAERASRAKTEFLASMSHELRTPLNAILGFGQLIEIDRALAERTRGHVREVMRAGRHLLRLINEVLDLAQVESGRLALSPEALRLNELVDEAAALTDAMGRSRRLRLRLEVPADLVVRADRMRLKQVLVNLLSNAAKYGREGTCVDVDAGPAGAAHVRLVVRDQGPGIPPERLAQLFQPFNRLGAELGGVEGTGIGLALSRRLMTAMDGAIGVDSVPGEGCAFWIELPAGELASAPPPDTAAGGGEAAPGQAADEVLVLCVEDNPANLALVGQILERHAGVRLISAPDGEQGLALARAHRPALILLDIHLPRMDGYEVLARLRADPATRAIPVLALTAQAMPSDARRAIEAGFDEYLSKPIDIPVFDTVLQRLLGQRTGGPPA